MLWLFLKGGVIGLSIAAPVGPIGLLVIRRTLAHGRLNGLATGMGAAMGDGTYGAVVALGVTAVSKLLLDQQGLIALVGGGLLLWLGLSIARSAPAPGSKTRTATPGGLVAATVSSFLLTLTSPVTILIFIGLFASLGASAGGDTVVGSLAVVAGVFSGSALWWVVLVGVTGSLRHRITDRAMRWINLGSGLSIAGFGAAAIVREAARYSVH